MSESEISATQPKKRLWVRLLRPKVAIPLGLFVLVLLSPVLYRGWNLGHVPDLGDPFRAELLEKPAVPDEDNAWVNYQRAEELRFIREQKVFFAHISFSEDYEPPDWTTPSREAIRLWHTDKKSNRKQDYFQPESNLYALEDAVNTNREALDCWKEGASKDRYKEVNPLPILEPLDGYTYNPYRYQLYQLAMARAGQLASQGKHSEALDWLLAVYRFSRHLTQSGGTDNWERAIEVSQGVFEALDELLDDDAYTHEVLIAFLRELEQTHHLTGDFEQALVDDYLSLRQQILNAHELNTKYGEELETGSSVNRKNRFEMYVEGEPQLSLRLLQHHFEYLKRNLKKAFGDRVVPRDTSSWAGLSRINQLKKLYYENSISNERTLSSEKLEADINRSGLLREFVEQDILFSNPLFQEIDDMLYDSLRLLIAAHAFAHRYPQNSNWKDLLRDDELGSNQFQIEQLPVVTMEELIADSLTDFPHDPYDSTSSLLLAVCRDGEVFIMSSISQEYDKMARGETPELLQNRIFTLGYVPYPLDYPIIDELKFQLPTPAYRKSLSANNRHAKGLQWVPESVPEDLIEYLEVLH